MPFAAGKAPAALAKVQCGRTSQAAHVDHGWSVQHVSATVTVVHACRGLSLPQAQAPHTLHRKAGADTPCPSPFLYLPSCSLTALTAYKLCSGGMASHPTRNSASAATHGPDGVAWQGMESVCVRAFGEALEVVPYTLAENAGLQAISIVTELRNRCACFASLRQLP